MSKKQKRIAIIGGSIALAIVLAFVFILVFVILPSNDDDNENGKFVVTSVEVQLDGITKTHINREFDSDSVQLSIRVNDGVDLSEYAPYTVTWTIVGETLGCTITNGLLTIGEVLGQITIRVSVTSYNTLYTDVPVLIIPKYGSVLTGITIVEPPNKTEYIEGQYFDRTGMIVNATFNHPDGNWTTRVDNFDVLPSGQLTNESLNGAMRVTVSFTHNNVTFSQFVDIFLHAKTLQSISVTTAPNTAFIEGQPLRLDNMVVTGHFEYITMPLVGWFTNIPIDSPLSLGTTSILVRYMVDSKIFETALPITVMYRTLQAIAVTGYRTTFVRYQRFDTSNLRVTAFYEFTENDVTNYVTINNTNPLSVGNQTITISYTERGVTRTHEVFITVADPYEQYIWLTIDGSPANVSVSWTFTFIGDDGQTEVIDFLNYYEHGFIFGGGYFGELFQIPVGAIVTITRVNPSIVDFFMNDTPLELEHTENSFEFTADDFDIYISYETVVGERITLIFENTLTNDLLILYFSEQWNGYLRVDHLNRIAFAFNAGGGFVYEFTINTNTYRFAELEYVNFRFLAFGSNDEIIPIRIPAKRTAIQVEETREVALVLWNGDRVYRTILIGYSVDSQIPEFVRSGYHFDRWELVGGQQNTYQGFWISRYGALDLVAAAPILGTWSATVYDVNFSFVFNADGSFVYTAGDFDLYGKFRVIDSEILIKTLHTTGDHIFADISDFSFEVVSGGILATVILVELGTDSYGGVALILYIKENIFLS